MAPNDDVIRLAHVETPDCWCGPTLYLLCPGCAGARDGCARCADSGHPGLVLATRAQYDAAQARDEATLTVHRDALAPVVT
jgi:hypothetical protein